MERSVLLCDSTTYQISNVFTNLAIIIFKHRTFHRQNSRNVENGMFYINSDNFRRRIILNTMKKNHLAL